MAVSLDATCIPCLREAERTTNRASDNTRLSLEGSTNSKEFELPTQVPHDTGRLGLRLRVGSIKFGRSTPASYFGTCS